MDYEELPELHADINRLTERVIGMAVEVHRILGPGLLETIYESALCMEFDDGGLPYARQKSIPVIYKGRSLKDAFRPDLIVDGRLVVEVKAMERFDPVF